MDSTLSLQPTIFIIFGGTGDLNSRKLAPALYNLYLDGFLPQQFTIIGTGRTKLTDEVFSEKLLEGINQFSRRGKADEAKWAEFSKHVTYQVSDINDFETYKEFGRRIDHYSKEWNAKPNVIYYLAVSPNFFPVIAENISKAKLGTDTERTRIVIEKPFGHDLESSKKLNALLGKIFDEKQIYRIDHYLGKETVQNIMAFRFANSILEPLWNRNYIQHVQISVTEQLGVGERGDYYDGAGALRDMIQNHLLQLLCLVAMESPVSFSADEVRNRKVDVLKAMRRFTPDDVRLSAVRGQYAKGWIEGKEVPGYREEGKVNP
ncbi:MAG: glucose-6-phosphate dehydrogenase, partial [Siphonobacter aquaeclarae]|nr:glucose-6-phosphate dehydrogenase [Siphonobacter aquaeclarae]